MSQGRSFLQWLRTDSAEAVFFLRTLFYIWPTAIIAGVFLAYFLFDQQRLSQTGFWVMSLLSVPGGLLFALLAWWLLGEGSRGFVGVLFAAGNIPPEPSFSLEESLIARGEFENARLVLESRVAEGRDTIATQLRLADLHARLLREPAAAARWYLAARSGTRDDRQRWEATNGLIDLYRASGETGRLMTELARLAQLWPGTRAGQDAKRELRDLKRETS